MSDVRGRRTLIHDEVGNDTAFSFCLQLLHRTVPDECSEEGGLPSVLVLPSVVKPDGEKWQASKLINASRPGIS